MKYISLDYYKKYDQATMIDTETGEIKAKRLAHIRQEFREFIGDRANTRMVMESCWNWSKTYELVKNIAEEVILAHPLKMRAIAEARIKTDKRVKEGNNAAKVATARRLLTIIYRVLTRERPYQKKISSQRRSLAPAALTTSQVMLIQRKSANKNLHYAFIGGGYMSLMYGREHLFDK